MDDYNQPSTERGEGGMIIPAAAFVADILNL
jgi:hypothetical protein